MLQVLLYWFVFVAVVYILVWLDDAYYRVNLPERFRFIYRELFEES